MADGIDLKEFRKLRKDLADFKPDKQTKKALKLAGELIAADAKAIVGPYSKSIPPTIRSRVSKTAVTVSAGGGARRLAQEMAKAPYGTKEAERHLRVLKRRAGMMAIAGLFERGNKGPKSKAARNRGTFRRPTFGHDPWVYQQMHPYLGPARDENMHSIEHFEGEIVAEAFREIGWH